MIAAIGLRTLAESGADFTQSRNLIVVALIMVFGLGTRTWAGSRSAGSRCPVRHWLR
jgi:xanthine/uracil permease